MSKLNNNLHTRVIIAGGGTGGHIFPALAIAKELEAKNPYIKLLFVGSKHRMEMQKIPEAGYEIRGLDIRGVSRKKWWSNIFIVFNLIKSFFVAHKILQEFQPSVVVGVGGYSSFPVLFIAQLWRIPTLIQEQNSYAGLTNRILGKRASVVCLGYSDAASFFPKATTLYTGNPVRQDLLKLARSSANSSKASRLHKRFGLSTSKPTVLVLGGSLGSGILNNFVMQHLADWHSQDIQLIWQCGTSHYRKIMPKIQDYPNIYATDFLQDMGSAYQVANVVISRAGALAVAEIASLKKPVIFVPLASATANHQFYNAQALVKAEAAIMVLEAEVKTKLYSILIDLLHNKNQQELLRLNLNNFQHLQATDRITNQILKLSEQSASPLRKVYMLGIGGAGMQALAVYLHQQGVEVAGYDRAKSRYTANLEDMGIRVDYQDLPSQIEAEVDWVIYTPAIKTNSPSMKYCKAQGIPLLKRSFVLGHLSRNAYNICVAGTHGKTSTCALFAAIVRNSGYKAHEFIGGEQILSTQTRLPSIIDYSPIYQLNIIEADEYDKSFLSLNPYLAVITSMDVDHLEVYGTEEKMRQTYYDFVQKIPPNGALILPYNLAQTNDFNVKNLITYSIQDQRATIFAQDLNYHSDNSVHFKVFINNILYTSIRLPQGTDFNVENSLAAIMLAHILEIPKTVVKDALNAYAGVRRRFELLYESANLSYIQDYAHHPRELEQSILSIRRRYPSKSLLVIFQPHLFSRTKYFYLEFARVLDLADEVILLPIYPAREEPIQGVDSALIGGVMQRNWRVLAVDNCLEWLKGNLDKWEVVMSVGAGGDLEQVAEDLLLWLKLNNDAR